jgi:hypothetical protein
VNFTSPSEHQACCPSEPAATPQKVGRRRSDPLMRSLAPSAHQVRSVHQRGIASAASFRPRRFSRPRRFAPPRTVPGSPRVTLLGFFALQGNSRLVERPRRYRRRRSSLTLPPQLLPSQGQRRSEELRRRAAAVCLRGITRRVDRIRPPTVSGRWGTDPLMGFSCGTSHLSTTPPLPPPPASWRWISLRDHPRCDPVASSVARGFDRPFGPVTFPDLKRA